MTQKSESSAFIEGLETVAAQRWWWIVAAPMAVGSITVSQAVLYIVGDSPEFFIAKGMIPAEIALAGVALVVVPGVLALPVLMVRPMSAPLSGGLLALILGTLVGILAVHRLDSADQTAQVALGVGGGVALAFASAYIYVSTLRSLIRFLSPAPLVILAVFIFVSPTSALFSTDGSDAGVVAAGSTDTPVVVLIFDEFPLSSVMNGDGDLAAESFPALARLAEDGVWYRNAVTNSPTTVFAIPSIMTGKITKTDLLPTVSDHPDSLFSALRSSHDVGALEPVTALCPISVCQDRSRSERWGIWESFASDVAVVLAHISLPEALSGALPPIDQTWGGFLADTVLGSSAQQTPEVREVVAAAVATGKRGPAFTEFRGLIETERDRPLFALGHFLLPHLPWTLLPDGTSIGSEGVRFFIDDVVVDDPWPVALAMQRHLLQAQYVDNEISRVMATMNEEGIYDDALVIVTSDHGLSFQPGTPRRGTAPSSLPGIAPVPLLVKYPAGTDDAPPPGSVDDDRAETIDIAPTIFATLGVTPPYEVDGISLLDTRARGERTETVLRGYAEPLSFPASIDAALGAARHMDQWFPQRDPWELRPPGEPTALMGSQIQLTDDPDIEIELQNPEQYQDVDLNAEPLPAVVVADVTGVEAGEQVVVAVNGEVAVETITHPWRDSIQAVALLPPEVLVDGANRVEVGVVTDGGDIVG